MLNKVQSASEVLCVVKRKSPTPPTGRKLGTSENLGERPRLLFSLFLSCQVLYELTGNGAYGSGKSSTGPGAGR